MIPGNGGSRTIDKVTAPTEETSKPASKVGVLIALQIAIFLSALDQTVLNIAIPKIATSLNAFDKGAWLITSYLLFATVATPVSGKLADIFGVKNVLLAATALFGITSAMCGVAGSTPDLFGLSAMDQLIISRALQGIAGGAMIGLCFVAVGELFSARERGKYQGWLAAAFIVAALIGPVLGGWLVEYQSWRYIFYLNVPPVLLAIPLIFASYPVSSRERAQSVIDYLGILLFLLFVAPLLMAFSDLGRSGALQTSSIIELVVALSCLCLFVVRERTAKEPLIPMSIFQDKLVRLSLLTVFNTGMGLFGSMLLLSMIMQELLNISAVSSGAILTPLMIVVAGTSIGGGISISKTGRYKALTLIALALMTVGTMLLSTVSNNSPLAILLTSATIGGLGLGLLLPIHAIIVQNAVEGKVLGVATSMTQFFRSLGGTIGTGFMSALLIGLTKQGSLELALHSVLVLYALTLLFTFLINLGLPVVELKQSKHVK